MGRPETLAAVREKYPQYADMPDDALGSALAAKYPQYADLVPKAEPAKAPKDSWAEKAYRFMGSVAGAEDPHLLAGSPVAKKGEHPTVEGAQDTVLAMLASAPLLAAGGMAASAAVPAGAPAIVGALAPSAGRVAAQGAVSKARGETWPQTFVDMAGAVLGEGGTAAAGKIAGKLGGRATTEAARGAEAARIGKAGGEVFPELDAATDKDLWGAAQQWGKKQVERVLQPALNEIERRLGGARALNLPGISDKPMSFRVAVEKMFAAEKDARRAIRAGIEQTLKGIDPALSQMFASAMEARGASYAYLGALKKGLDPSGKLDPSKLAKYVNANYEKLQAYAGRYWPKIEAALLGPGKQAPVEIAPKRGLTIAGRKIQPPMWASEAGQKIAAGAENPAVRAMIDAALGSQPTSEIALSAALSLAPSFGTVAKHAIPHMVAP